MYDQTTADLLTETETLRRERYASDLKCARMSGMTEEAAKEYADRMALHPSRGGFPATSHRLSGAASKASEPLLCVETILSVVEHSDLLGKEQADLLAAKLGFTRACQT